ncbi:ABC transporter ATP-binding protein [Dactylosporangium sp. CA-139066]|uniref:ABC transporter ATP-binding protein n=1 Tax=Dactylosporangium sp. CA-139066 TaxID=3239930 RepID=UPI003D914BBC
MTSARRGPAGPAPLGVRVALGHARAAFALAWRAAPGCVLTLVALTAAGAAAPVATAWLTKVVLDRLAATGSAWPALLPFAAGLAVAGLVTGVLPHAARYASAELERRAGVDALARLYAAVNALPGLARLESSRFQDRLLLAERACKGGPGMLVTNALVMVQALLTAAGLLAALAALTPLIAAVVLASAVPVVWVQLSLSAEQAALMWRVGHGQRREFFYARLLSTPNVAMEVRLFGLGDFFGARMLAELSAVNAANRALGRRQLRRQGALALLGAAVSAGGLGWMLVRAAGGGSTVGDVSMFVAAVAGVQGSLSGAVQSATGMHQALSLFDHLRAVLATRSGPALPASPPPVPPLRHGIELRDVWFRYDADQPWVLRGVSVFIPCGQTLALVGLNGAGKSTLVKLLCRFYDPDRGSIRWDGTDLRELDPAGLRERIGAVFQNFAEYDLSAAENVAVGDLGSLDDRARIEAAARRAGVHDVLDRLPLGYDTLLTRIFMRGAPGDDPQDGVLLSGGQWQRVALARALLRDTRDLMILDEPSAGLDARAEHEVHTTLRARRTGRTTLLISHRLSTVRDADRIVVLADGAVIEDGRHADLVARRGRYAELFELQARGYAEQPAPAGAPS